MATTIALSDAAKYYGKLTDSMRKAARVGLIKAGERGLQILITEIIPSRSPEPVDRGTYKAGWKTEQIDETTVAILNPEAHAAIIEFGARSENIRIGTAMLTAIQQWAIRKGIATDEKEALDVAWAIAKSMKRKGIFNNYQSGGGLRILEELVEKHLQRVLNEEVSREVARAVEAVR